VTEVRTRPAPACAICGREGPVAYGGLRDPLFGAPGVWSLRHCAACGFGWLDPQPLPDDIGKLYGAYHTHGGEPGWLARMHARLFGLPRWLDRLPRGRLLDVGCGDGAIAASLRDRGWTVAGVEPDPAAARAAQSRGLDVVAATLEDARFDDASFDAVVMSHVIEHVPDPRATMRECARILRPGGTLLVVTPNFAGRGRRTFGEHWRGLEVPRHLHLFTPQSLAAMARAAGLAARVRTSARSAAWMYAVSAQLRAGRPSDSALTAGLGTKIAAVAFQLTGAGEELVMTARRH